MKNFITSLLLLSLGLTLNAQEIEVITQEKIQGIINIIVYSPNGSLIASGSEKENSIKVWDVKSGKIIGKLEGHEGATTAIAFNKEGTQLVSGAEDKRIMIWDIIKWELIDSVSLSSEVNWIANDPTNDNKFYTGTQGGEVNLHYRDDLSATKELFKRVDPITRLDVSKSYLVAGNKSGKMFLYSFSDNKVINEKKLHFGAIRGLKFYNNGEGLISTGGGGAVHLWNVNDLSESKHFKASSSLITAFDVNTEKGFFVTASGKSDVRVWSMEGKEMYYFKGNDKDNPGAEPIRAIAISPDGSTVASAGFQRIRSLQKKTSSNVIRIWDIERGTVYKVLKGTVNPIYTFDFHPVENKLVTLGEDRILTFWNFDHAEKYGEITLMEPKREVPPKRVEELADKGTDKANNDGGKKIGGLINDAKNGNLKLKDKFKDGVEVTKETVKVGVKDQAAGLGSMVIKRAFKERAIIKFSSKGSYLITKLPKDEIRRYKMENGVPTYDKPLFSYQSNVNQILCSPDEKYLAVLGSGEYAVTIIDMQSGEYIRQLSTPAPDPDKEGNRSMTLKYLYEANSLAFSPDGRYLAVCFNTGKTYVYSVGSWSIAFENILPDNMGYVKGAFVNFSVDGKTMLVKTMRGLQKYNTSSFNQFDTKPMQIDGESAPMDKPSDYAITIKDNRLYFENLISGAYQKSIHVNSKQITHVSVNRDGKIGMTLTTGQFLLFNPSSALEEAQMVADGDNYILKTSENYYKVSKDGYDLVTFRIGNRAYPFEQFDAVFNRPDLVLASLGCDDKDLMDLYKRAYEKRIKKLGLTPTKSVKLSDIPTAEIHNPKSIPAATSNESVTLDFTIGDQTALASYNVWVNNVPIYGKQGKQMTGKSFSGKEEVSLVSGMNKIQFASRNKNGYESLMETFYVDKSTEVIKRDLYLVTVGTSSYKDDRYNLHYAVKDAKDLVNLFGADSSGVYNNVKTRSLYDQDVTSENIESVKSFLAESKPDDVVLIFVAGHGVLDANFDYYFGTHDMDFGNPSEKGLAYEKLEGLLDGIKANKKILIMDTCHSGEIDKDEAFFVEPSEEEENTDDDIAFRAVGNAVSTNSGSASPSRVAGELFNDLRRGTGATVISSAGGAEYAMESDEWKNGLFTYCMLTGLKTRNADLDQDGEIMLLELQAYVVELVAKLSKGKQVPNSRIQNLELDFRVW